MLKDVNADDELSVDSGLKENSMLKKDEVRQIKCYQTVIQLS